MKLSSKIYTGIIFAFLFAPIAILLVFSFNEAKSLAVFSGVSLKWYKELFNDLNTLETLKNSIILAASAMAISTVMGTAAAFGIDKLRGKWFKTVLNTVTNIPMINPDIITGISMMLVFVFVGNLFGSAISLNFWTLLIAHVTFCLPYVIFQVLPKLRQMDDSLAEAAQDLGCTPFRTFFKVILPEILPGIITGAIMAFTLSLDDFVISYFTSGNDFQTLPIRIYGMTKKTVTPDMYALATVIFFVTLVLLLVNNVVDSGEDGKEKKKRERERHGNLPIIAAIGVLAAAICGFVIYGNFGGGAETKPLTLNVYNWGEYISDGGEDTLDTVREFEKWYEKEYGRKVKVNYTTFASNEDMYSKISSGAVSYDVIIPSDYMIARMAKENMLLPLDFENIPNYKYIDEDFKSLYYDPEGKYTVPYAYGIIGVIYNANEVDEADTGDWDLLWNEKYKDKILQFNNSRDAFGMAMYKLGLDVNSESDSVWYAAHNQLIRQRPLVYSYVMDEIYNMMSSGEAAIGAYYAGDYFTMRDSQADNVDLEFYYPENTNYYVDAMCIPSCCENKELAEIFINFMTSEEPAVANAEYTYYASPNRLVYENAGYIESMGDDAMEILYSRSENFKEQYNKNAYRNLTPETLSKINTLWEILKIN